MILLVLAGTAFAQPWYLLYDQARDDIAHQRWESAIIKLERAVAQKADSGISANGKGPARIAYFPYFLMGKAYYHLGQFDLAAGLFNRETRVGLPGRISTEIDLYQRYLRAINEDRKRLARFNEIVERAKLLRARGAFAEAADTLRRARQYHPAEFERLDLGHTAEQWLKKEQRAQAKMMLAAKNRHRSPAPHRRGSVEVVSMPPFEAVRRAVLSAYEGPPDQAVKLLEVIQTSRKTRNAELESATGIAYARLSFLTVNPEESERFREKAIQQFRLALALDPGLKLDSRLVAPQIMDLFATSR